MNWTTPNNAFEVRYFMGLTSYYQRFIEWFSNISHPITYLQKKGIKLDLTIKCETNFQKLKEMLTSELVLKIANQDENFVVCTDACN